jgi:signal transduction histidine kinase
MLQAVFDGILDPLILIDKKCRVKIINKVAAEYYGLDNPGDIIGKYCYDALRGRLAPCDGCEIPEAVMSDRSLTFERRGIMDPARLEQVVIYPVKEKADQVGDAIIRITDITEAKQLERQVIQSEKMASLGVLVSSIAHEINNPNNFVSFNIPILKDYLQEIVPILDEYADKQTDFEICNMAYPEFRQDIFKLLDNISHGSGRISSFVANLREFAQSGDQKPKSWVDLASITEKVLSICQGEINKTIRSFVKNISENLPEVYTDAHALEQIMINLLVNAAQAADKKDSWVKLNLTVKDDWQNHTMITVSDNGSGIDDQIRLKIFDPFFTTKPPAEGTGLGLYVCHNLVESLGGRIEVESVPGEGSTFTIILPDKERREKSRTTAG